MERSGERAALAGVFLSLVAAVTASFDGRVGWEPAALHLWAAAICAVVAVQLYLKRRASEEAEEYRLAREQPSASLFQPETASEEGPLARSAAVFERGMVPWIAPLLGAAVLTLAIASWKGLPRGLAEDDVAATLEPATRHIVTAFVLLVGARYLISAAKLLGVVVLRGAGSALGVAAVGAGLAGAAALGRWAGVQKAEALGRAAVAIWMGVLGIEQLVRALLGLYRPRRPDEPPSASYESALALRLLDPASWWRVAAETVDYQFGFGFSRTSVARRIARAFVPYVFVQAVVLYGWTSVTILGPEEEGVRERLGRPIEGPAGWVGPGWHWTWPWPFETIRRAPARRIQRLTAGVRDEQEPWSELLWSRPHYRQEDLFLSAVRSGSGTAPSAVAPVNVLAVNVPIEYRITNVVRYLYGAADPQAALRAAIQRELTAELASRDIWDVLGPGQAEFGRSLAQRIRRAVERLNLGVEVTSVALRGAHPPVEVAESFEDVVAALEAREAAVHRARGQVDRIEAEAGAASYTRRTAAAAARERRTLVAAAEAERFRARRAAAAAGPSVYTERAALDAVRVALERPRLYLVAAPAGREVVQLNLEPKVASVLWDIGALTNRGVAGRTGEQQEGGR